MPLDSNFPSISTTPSAALIPDTAKQIEIPADLSLCNETKTLVEKLLCKVFGIDPHQSQYQNTEEHDALEYVYYEYREIVTDFILNYLRTKILNCVPKSLNDWTRVMQQNQNPILEHAKTLKFNPNKTQ